MNNFINHNCIDYPITFVNNIQIQKYTSWKWRDVCKTSKNTLRIKIILWMIFDTSRNRDWNGQFMFSSISHKCSAIVEYPQIWIIILSMLLEWIFVCWIFRVSWNADWFMFSTSNRISIRKQKFNDWLAYSTKCRMTFNKLFILEKKKTFTMCSFCGSSWKTVNIFHFLFLFMFVISAHYFLFQMYVMSLIELCAWFSTAIQNENRRLYEFFVLSIKQLIFF